MNCCEAGHLETGGPFLERHLRLVTKRATPDFSTAEPAGDSMPAQPGESETEAVQYHERGRHAENVAVAVSAKTPVGTQIVSCSLLVAGGVGAIPALVDRVRIRSQAALTRPHTG